LRIGPLILSPETYSIKADENVTISLLTNRVALNFAAVDLPSGLELNSTTGLITGSIPVPGSYNSTIEASNQAGTYSKNINFVVTDFSAWKYSTNITFTNYSGSSTLKDFPVYLEFNSSLPGFSYDQFASPYGYDLEVFGE
jgi:hypothetical protein